MESISFNKFKKCLDDWAKQNEIGEQCLSRQVLGKPSIELEPITNNLRQILDCMFDEYCQMLHKLEIEEIAVNNEQESNNHHIPEQVVLLKKCLEMYDQEYMVKDCIRDIVSGEGFATQQHLAGSMALWRSESYLDEEIQRKIKHLN
ncbi:uncharacterized protein BX663DRAFT_548543 [Cokeromyces recurvatus]|uniref:uncharacterized protein n=1 Tax=Cokeromyces recurvatus TaxID=90255 RepID=UPI0022202414|nr:uncharacterized protein BX663DRAFT_548543 [Cokeromyces recurvatus]KAI7906354.1 hypothetical protein BX663DRAFT_548543 [Cokeromyces recurvatus]